MLNNELVLNLLRAESEVEVVALLDGAGLWADDSAWRPLGDSESNYGIINNQQGDAFGALVEKIVNSIDARLELACLLAGIDPTTEEAPRTGREVVARFIEEADGGLHDSDGLLALWEERGIDVLAQARKICVVATGSRDQTPNISIIDEGVGQTPSNFPETFMSLVRGNKAKIPFVTGKWNMGGTGALPFCSKQHKFQVVISKRNPLTLGPTVSDSDRNWGCSVVRQRPRREGDRLAVFEYLAPADTEGVFGVLECDLESLPLFPSESPDKAFARPSDSGTMIKLIEYEWQKSGVTGASRSTVLAGEGLRTQVDCRLADPLLPVRLFEGRDYGGSSSAVTISGILNKLRKGDLVEPECPITAELNIRGSRLPVEVNVLRKNNDAGKAIRPNSHSPYGVILALNGQMHAHLEPRWFANKAVDLSYIKKSIVVVVDCSSLANEDLDTLFMASRDRARDTELYQSILSGLADLLKHDRVLRETNNRRREEEINEQLADDKPLVDVLKKMMKSSPLLANFLKLGGKISAPFAGSGASSGSSGTFSGRATPTFLRFVKNSDTTLKRTVEAGSRARIDFETDAQNDYFSRVRMRGIRAVTDATNSPVSGSWGNLHDGFTSFNLMPIPLSEVGKTLVLKVLWNDPTRTTPLECSLELTVIAPGKPKGSGTKGGRKSADSGRGSSGSPDRLEMPPIQDKSHDDDEDWTDRTAMTVNLSDGKADQFWYNRDNRFLKDAQKRSKSEPRLLEHRFKLGLALLSLSLIDSLENSGAARAEDDVEAGQIPDTEEEVARLTAAVAPVLLPMIEGLASIDPTDLDDDD